MVATSHMWLFKFNGKLILTLVGVAQLVGHPPVNRKVVGLIPSQGTYLGYGFHPLVWAQMGDHQLMLLSRISGSLPPSLSKSN